MSTAHTPAPAASATAPRARRWRSLAAVAVVAAGLAVAPPAGAEVRPPVTISITPASGPYGTVITATITGCFDPAETFPDDPARYARMDFYVEGFTPSETVFVEPDGNGDATAQITASDKIGYPRTGPGKVAVYRCGGGGGDEVVVLSTRQVAPDDGAVADFTVTADTPDDTTPPTGTPTSTTPDDPAPGPPVTPGGTAATDATPAAPVAGSPSFTG